MSEPLGERVISVVRFPDGRFAVHNEQDISEITLVELGEIIEILRFWTSVHWEKRGGP